MEKSTHAVVVGVPDVISDTTVDALKDDAASHNIGDVVDGGLAPNSTLEQAWQARHIALLSSNSLERNSTKGTEQHFSKIQNLKNYSKSELIFAVFVRMSTWWKDVRGGG